MSRWRRLFAVAAIAAAAAVLCGATTGGRAAAALDGSVRRAGSDEQRALVGHTVRAVDARSTNTHPRPVLLAVFLGALGVLVALVGWAVAGDSVVVIALAHGCHRQRGPPALA
jgi:hypothetical protein